MKINTLLIVVLLLVILGGLVFVINWSMEVSDLVVEPQPVYSSPALTPKQSPRVTQSVEPIFFPMRDYTSRITNRWYGKTITPADREALPCGVAYEGIHTGDDLETINSEKEVDVPIFAIAKGTVRQVQAVNGYGGLIVIEHQLPDQPVTAYYGHIDLAKAVVKAGEAVTAGQLLTVLGGECSNQAGGERKHLHFAMRKGVEIDVRGYVESMVELEAWLNPKTILIELKARQPSLLSE